jgi:hypothetical protein
MKITDPEMGEKLARALKAGNDLYSLSDIHDALVHGSMQGHVIGDTWVLTRVHDWPKRRSVDIMFVVGHLEEALQSEGDLVKWSKGLGASLMTATGRDGWWEHRTPGWKKSGVLYTKDI